MGAAREFLTKNSMPSARNPSNGGCVVAEVAKKSPLLDGLRALDGNVLAQSTLALHPSYALPTNRLPAPNDAF
jgi:hypothetical protein